jgi:Ankyrin repeats (3 copies)/MYND finger
VLTYLGQAVETGKAPGLTGTETPLKLGYATLVVLGGQRLSMPNHYRFLHPATLKFLLENGCPPDIQDVSRHTALSHATEIPEDNADLARILITHGANVNHPDIYGMTPIFQAVMAAHSKAVDVLMEGGADLDITDADGCCIRNTYIRCGPKVTAVIHAWERRRAGKKMSLGEKGCALCGKDGKLLSCSACHSIRYCSSECQSMWATFSTRLACY